MNSIKKALLVLTALALLVSFTACTEFISNPPASDTSKDTTAVPEIPGTAGPGAEPAEKIPVDLFLFVGGDNMAGRGENGSAVKPGVGTAFEFRAASDPTGLYPLTSAFGSTENNGSLLNDTERKSGGMVPAFCKSYYDATKTPVVAVSCSEGGSTSAGWCNAGQGKLVEIVNRLEAAQKWLAESDTYALRHTYTVWLQGEADADSGVSGEEYAKNVLSITKVLQKRGVEGFFIVQTGNCADRLYGFRTIQDAQRKLCDENDFIVLISDMLPTLDSHIHSRYLYDDAAYDLLGADAGANAALYVTDPENYKNPDRRVYEESESDQFNGTGVELPVIIF